VISFGGFLYVIGVVCWDHPVFVLLIGAVVLWMVYAIRKIRRTERAEIGRFQQRTPLEDSEFLSEIGIDPTSPEAEVAVNARQAFADLGSVPAESLQASDRFYPDMEKLPFYDSIDSLGIILELEQKLDFGISEADAERLLSIVVRKESATVGEAVMEVLQLWKRHQAQEPPSSE
jgi:acyl carrier protein